MTGIPVELAAIAELPTVEDLILYILRSEIQTPHGVNVQSAIELDQTFPLIQARRGPGFGEWDGDERFTDEAQLSIFTFAQDPNGDADAAKLAEIVRVILRDSVNRVVPGMGYLYRVQMTQAPRRTTDWATSAGPVQFADLPTGVWRYETMYAIGIRRPSTTPYPIPEEESS